MIDNKNETKKIEKRGIKTASVTIILEKLMSLPEAKQKKPDNHAVNFEVINMLLISQTQIKGISINIAWIKNNFFIPSKEQLAYDVLSAKHNIFDSMSGESFIIIETK